MPQASRLLTIRDSKRLPKPRQSSSTTHPTTFEQQTTPTVVQSQSRTIKRQPGFDNLHGSSPANLTPSTHEDSSTTPSSVLPLSRLRPVPISRAPTQRRGGSVSCSRVSSGTPLAKALTRGIGPRGTIPTAVPSKLPDRPIDAEDSSVEEVPSLDSSENSDRQTTIHAESQCIDDWIEGVKETSISDVTGPQASSSPTSMHTTRVPSDTLTIAREQSPPCPSSPALGDFPTVEAEALQDIRAAKEQLLEAQKVRSDADRLVLRLTEVLEQKIEVGQRLCSVPLTANGYSHEPEKQRAPSLTESERERIVRQIREGKDDPEARWQEANRRGQAKLFLAESGRRG